MERPEHRKYDNKDEWEVAVFLSASYFTVILTFGAGVRKRREYLDLELAVAQADRWHGPYGRRPVVYAVTPSGRSTPLDRAMWPMWLDLWRRKQCGEHLVPSAVVSTAGRAFSATSTRSAADRKRLAKERSGKSYTERLAGKSIV